MDEELKAEIERAIGQKQAESGEATSFSEWMRGAARDKLESEKSDSSGSWPEEGVA